MNVLDMKMSNVLLSAPHETVIMKPISTHDMFSLHDNGCWSLELIKHT